MALHPSTVSLHDIQNLGVQPEADNLEPLGLDISSSRAGFLSQRSLRPYGRRLSALSLQSFMALIGVDVYVDIYMHIHVMFSCMSKSLPLFLFCFWGSLPSIYIHIDTYMFMFVFMSLSLSISVLASLSLGSLQWALGRQ